MIFHDQDASCIQNMRKSGLVKITCASHGFSVKSEVTCDSRTIFRRNISPASEPKHCKLITSGRLSSFRLMGIEVIKQWELFDSFVQNGQVQANDVCSRHVASDRMCEIDHFISACGKSRQNSKHIGFYGHYWHSLCLQQLSDQSKSEENVHRNTHCSTLNNYITGEREDAIK